VGVVNEELRKKLTAFLAKRFNECNTKKNCTLIRYDIIEEFRKIFDKTGYGKIKETALRLIETEQDLKCQKKNAGLWKEFIKEKKEKK